MARYKPLISTMARLETLGLPIDKPKPWKPGRYLKRDDLAKRKAELEARDGTRYNVPKRNK